MVVLGRARKVGDRVVIMVQLPARPVAVLIVIVLKPVRKVAVLDGIGGPMPARLVEDQIVVVRIAAVLKVNHGIVDLTATAGLMTNPAVTGPNPPILGPSSV